MIREAWESSLWQRGRLRGPPPRPDAHALGSPPVVVDADAPFMAEPRESLRWAARRMLDQDLACLVVATAGSPCGLLLDWSLVVGVLCLDLEAGEAIDTVRWHPFVAAHEGGRASEAAWLMEYHAIHSLPMLDEAGRIVRVQSIEDAFARVLAQVTALAATTGGSAGAGAGEGCLRSGAALRARDVWTPAAIVDGSAPSRAVAERLCVAPSGALVVVDGGQPIGVVTERALLERFVAGRASPACVVARDLVERPLAWIAPEERVDATLARMAEGGLRQIAVGFDRGGFGIVTLRELISQLVLELAARVPFAPPRRVESTLARG